MVVILSGPDGVGKTTVFQKLQEEIRHCSFIREPHPGPSKMFRVARSESLRLYTIIDKHVRVIYDRATLLDDLVYEPIFAKQPSIFSAYDRFEQETKRILQACTIIHFECAIGELATRLEQRGDDMVDKSLLSTIINGYNDLFRQLDIVPHRVDTTGKKPEQVLQEVMQIIKEKL